MPTGPIPVVVGVERGRLRITEVACIVAATVDQVDTADEGDVLRRSALVLHHHHLLVVAASPSDAVVEQDLTATLVHGAGEHQVLLLRVHQSVGSPHQPANIGAGVSQGGQHVGHLGPGTRQQLVGIAFDTAHEHRVTRSSRPQRQVQADVVLGPVDQHIGLVAFCPRNPAATPVDRGAGVASLSRGEEPVIQSHGGHDRNVQLAGVGRGGLKGGHTKDKLDDAVDSVENKLN